VFHSHRLLLQSACITAAALSVLSGVSLFAQASDDSPSSSQPTISGASSESGAVISGTVLDINGNVIQGAHVRLSQTALPGAVHETESGSMGQFDFSGLSPGTYTLTVSTHAMTTFVSGPITIEAQQAVIVPKIVLGIAPATISVTVMDPEQASIVQVEIAEQQRVFKVFPNFYSSFDWNAPPMLAKQKYHLAARTLVDPVSFLTTAAVAGAEQYQNVFPSFGSGFEGYAKRYGAAYAEHASSELFTRAVFPSIFHTDPRYFIMGSGSTRSRAMHAVTSTVVTRGDNGSRRINFSEILGGFSAAALSNAYFPADERGLNLVLVNGFAGLGGNMLDNLIREFVLNRFTSRAKH
jgi:hypothetical protein